MPDNHSRFWPFVNFGPPFYFHVFIIMFLAAFPGTPTSIFNRLKELVSSIHTLKLSIGYNTSWFVLLCISFHVFKYLLSLELRLVYLFLILFLVLGLLKNHGFELLLHLEQLSHLQHEAHPSIVTEPIVHAHQCVLIHILLNSTCLMRVLARYA